MKEIMLMVIGVGVFLLVGFSINDIVQKAKEQERERLEAEYVQKVETELAEMRNARYKREIGAYQESKLEETKEEPKDELTEIKQLIADKKYLEAIAKLEAMKKEEK